MPKDVNIHIKTQGGDESRREIDKTSQSARQMGDGVQDAGRKSQEGGEKIARTGKNATRAAGGMNLLGRAAGFVTKGLLGLLAITGLDSFFSKWADYARKAAAAQRELADSTRELDQATKALASQANVMGSPEGVDQARRQIEAIQQQGRLADWKQAKAIAVALHSAYGTSGQLLSADQMGIAGVVADTAQREDLSGKAVSNMIKVLSAMQASNAQEARQRIQQLTTAQKAAGVDTFEEFITGGIGAILPQLAFGGSPEVAMAQYGGVLASFKSGEEGAERVKQAVAMMNRPAVAKAVGGGYAQLPFDQRLKAFRQWVARSSDKELMAAGLTSDQLNVLRVVFKPENIQKVREIEALTQKATAEEFTRQAEGYWQTRLGKSEAIRAKTLAESVTDADVTIGMDIEEQAKIRYKQKLSRGEVSKHIFEEHALDQIEAGILYERVKQLKAEGKITDNQAIGLILEIRSKYRHTSDIPLIGKTVEKYTADPFTPQEIGKLSRKLDFIESGGGGTVNTNIQNGDTYITVEQGVGDDDHGVPGPRSFDLR